MLDLIPLSDDDLTMVAAVQEQPSTSAPESSTTEDKTDEEATPTARLASRTWITGAE